MVLAQQPSSCGLIMDGPASRLRQYHLSHRPSSSRYNTCFLLWLISGFSYSFLFGFSALPMPVYPVPSIKLTLFEMLKVVSVFLIQS